MNKTTRAFEFANMKHQGQTRKDGSPYFQHPIRVMANIMQFKVSIHLDEIMAAALLHDSLEDTYTSYRELEEMFGPIVAGIVMECTTNDSVCKQIGKAVYLKEKMLMMSNYGLTVKLADRLDNVQDLAHFAYKKAAKKIIETSEILDYLIDTRGIDNMNTASRDMIIAIQEKMDDWKTANKDSWYQYSPLKVEQTETGDGR